ncbi:tetratricopeptide repeat protein [Massilia aurea]|uniref:tetratricopeptide repeat protein n=1 Tax=Massilia aurea TaxID=373040 RepID=UPI0034634370
MNDSRSAADPVLPDERTLGDEHPVTLDCREDLAHTLAGRRDYERARIVCERVLDGRRRQQGSEHRDTLRCAQRLALLLGKTGDFGNARRMLEAVLRAYARHDGLDDAGVVAAHKALADILAAQGGPATVRHAEGAAGSQAPSNPAPLR